MKKNSNIYTAMIHDEKKAPGDYTKLLSKVKTPKAKKVIRGIIKDERRHFRLLNKLKKHY